jgi:hypothetical protein
MRTIAAAVILVPCLTHMALAAQGPNVREGQWDTTIKVEMPGMPMDVPPFTTSSCITKKDLVPKAQQPGQDCKTLKQEVKGDTVEWTVQCKDASGMTMDGAGSAVYKGDTYSGEMTLTMSGAGHPSIQMKYTLNGKRTGDCKKEAAKPK